MSQSSFVSGYNQILEEEKKARNANEKAKKEKEIN